MFQTNGNAEALSLFNRVDSIIVGPALFAPLERGKMVDSLASRCHHLIFLLSQISTQKHVATPPYTRLASLHVMHS